MANILIVKTAALGDVLRTTVILEGLREKYLNPDIYWFTSKSAKPLLENNPFIERLFYKEDENPAMLKLRYDLIISLEEDEQLLKVLHKLKKRKLFGVYTDKDGKIRYTPHSAMWYDMSLASRFGKQTADELKKANLFSYPELLYKMLDLPWSKQRYRLFLTKKDMNYAKALKIAMAKNRTIIGVVVSAGERWPMKTLPHDRQIDFLKRMHRRFGKNATILLLTGPSSLELAVSQTIKQSCPFVLTHEIQDIDEFIGIMNLCNIVVTPDTLSMHIAIALTKYVLAYFTVTSANEIEIYSGEKIIASHPDFCSYTKEGKPRPNITDKVDIDEMLESISKLIKTHDDF